MRINNLTQLAARLKKIDNENPRIQNGFDMEQPYGSREFSKHPCGSACCIGGWVQHYNTETRHLSLADTVLSISPFGIDHSEADNLCFPQPESDAWNATPQQAARAVEILRDTGKCDWDRAMNEVSE